jgi:hypothetical protein
MTGAFGSSMRTARAGARCMCVQKCEYACVSAWCMMNPNVYRTYVQGIVAREAIREGDLLFKIPLKWCMHSVAAKRNKYLAKPLSQGVLPRGMQGEAIMVALLLMVEACQIGEASSTCALRAQTSAWLPYIRALPTNFSAPVFWSTSDFRELKGRCVCAMPTGKTGLVAPPHTHIPPVLSAADA